MSKTRSVVAGFSLIVLFTLLLNVGRDAIALSAIVRLIGAGGSEIQVTLSAPYTTTSWDGRVPQPQTFDLPLLYLHHEREATAATDRTLAMDISGLAGGTEIQIETLSLHVDVSTANPHRETKSFVLPDRPCTTNDPCTVQWTFDARTTPSDLYYLRVTDRAGNTLWENPYPERPDFVLLVLLDIMDQRALSSPPV